MKTAAVLFLALALTASAVEKKLWTWHLSEAAASEVTGSAILASASDATGNTALVIGEWCSRPEGQDQVKRARLLWISAKGAVLHEETVDLPYEHYAAVSGAERLIYPWSVISIGSNRWMVTDGRAVWTGVLKGKSAAVSQRIVDETEEMHEVVPAGTIAPFSGYFDREGGGPQGWTYNYPQSDPPPAKGDRKTGGLRKITGLSLWSVR